MTNRISPYVGIDWLTFLASRPVSVGRDPVIAALTAMLEAPCFFEIDETCTRTIAEWNALFGMEDGGLN
jgi:hypothetical protein